MIRRVLRKLVVMATLWLLGPIALVLGHAALLPDRVGAYDERTGPTFDGAGRGPYVYQVPADAGTLHEFQIGPVAGFGAPEERLWHGFGPTDGPPRPVIVLLHGAGRNGASMIDMWQDLAKRQNVVLVAPDARAPRWSLVTEGPMFLSALLKDAAEQYAIDFKSIYLVGHSNGGAHAMRIANLGGGVFRAVATHSGHSNRLRMIPALNPVPIHSFVGDADVAFTVESSRAALTHLARAGHPTSLTVIPGHNHWYYGIGKNLASVMWQRLGADQAPPQSPGSPPPAQMVQRSAPVPTDRATGAKWVRVPGND